MKLLRLLLLLPLVGGCHFHIHWQDQHYHGNSKERNDGRTVPIFGSNPEQSDSPNNSEWIRDEGWRDPFDDSRSDLWN